METKWDIADEFDDICTMLFSSLVLIPNSRSSDKISHSYETRPQPLMCLRVLPSSESGVPIEINREVNIKSGYWDYPLKTIRPTDADLRFINFFDFDHVGFRDFQYCHVRIVASEKFPEIIGRDALIENNFVSIHLID